MLNTLTPEDIPNLKRIDFEEVEMNAIWIAYGKKNTGKSFFVRWLMYHMREIIPYCIVFTGTKFNNFWQQHVPARFIFEGFQENLLIKILQCQAQRVRDPNPLFLLILEDLASEQIVRYVDAMRRVSYNSRHLYMMTVITTQYPAAFTPGTRDNADYAVILKQKSKRSRTILSEQYGDELCESPDDFLRVLDELVAEKFKLMIVDNVTKDKIGKDTVYWEKAEDPGPFRFGNDSWWGVEVWEEQLKKFPVRKPLEREAMKKAFKDNSITMQRLASKPSLRAAAKSDLEAMF
jgi:hypothetical protein